MGSQLAAAAQPPLSVQPLAGAQLLAGARLLASAQLPGSAQPPAAAQPPPSVQPLVGAQLLAGARLLASAQLPGSAQPPGATTTPPSVVDASPNASGTAFKASGAAEPDSRMRTKSLVNTLVPVLDIVGFDLILNRLDFYFGDRPVYNVSSSSIQKNARAKWVVDTDKFEINQIYHPYQGNLDHGFARSAGHGYWAALGYTFGGSVLWEIAGETGPPSINDQITTGIGGTFLGEPLFRLASLLLEGGDGSPGFWRRLAATAVSPATGLNRLAYGNRFDTVYLNHNPAVFTRLRLGASRSDRASQYGVSEIVQRKEVIADFHLTYGSPGRPGYEYKRPFDYFDFQFTAVSSKAFENFMSRGLLVGTAYGSGGAYQGVWGLYGGFDYISPHVFRVSSTALSVGTTGQWQPAAAVTIQGTLLGGVGWGAAGTTRSSSAERDYHYGLTPSGLFSVRLLVGSVATLDMTLRGFRVTGIASTERHGSEQILRGDAALTVRVFGRNTITLRYVASRRDAHYPDLADRHQTIGTYSILFGFISDRWFGAVTAGRGSAGRSE